MKKEIFGPWTGGRKLEEITRTEENQGYRARQEPVGRGPQLAKEEKKRETKG